MRFVNTTTQSETLMFLPYRFTRRGAKLLDLQCWLWGQDIKREEGNLLLQAGMDRLRPPDNVSGCSQYSMEMASGAILKLWGFGFYCGKQAGCYLNRYKFVPRQAANQNCWTGESFENAPRTTAIEALPEALRWIASYEETIIRTLGTRYRWSTAAAGPGVISLAVELSDRWSDLARDIEHWLNG